MRFRRRSSVFPRAAWPNGLERTEPLKGQLWTRSERALREPDVHWSMRAVAGLAALVEAMRFAGLGSGPALAVHSVEVLGARHLSAIQVAQAAGLFGNESIISVDGESAQQRLLAQVWVRTATVQPQFPGKVVVSVSEWQPVAAYHAGASPKLFLLSSQAVVVGPAATASGLVVVQGRAGPQPHAGGRPSSGQLRTALVNMQRAVAALVLHDVASIIF